MSSMNKYKICIYAICKDESKFVDRWMDAVSEADMVIVTDTGSTDDTVERLRKRGAVVYQEEIKPWRFDAARNAAMDHIPEDADICVSNDIDEVFEPGWRKRLEEAWKPEYTRARYWFVWERNDNGDIIKKFPSEKIHRRHGFRWVHPVHEVLEYSGRDPESIVFIDDIVLHHYPDPNKSRGQYLPLLEMSAKENPQDDRGMFWLGREYYFYGRYDDAIETLGKHLNMPSAGWDEEKSASMRFIAKSYLAKENRIEAKSWLFKAVAQCPYVREPWVELAGLGYLENDWPLCFYAAEMGLSITSSTSSYLVDPASWGYCLHDFAAIACYRLGHFKKALAHAEAACQIEPENPRLEQNRQLIVKEVGENE